MSSPKKALLLGAGFVVRPTIDLLTKAGVEVTVACRTLENAKKLCAQGKNINPTSLDVFNEAELESAVDKVDIIISLIPATHHVVVVKAAIKKKKNVVTTSYISPALAELEQQIKDAGITVMNEIGLDPGIDHLYAVSVIERVHKEGGKIISFLSYCGGLPAPETSDNALGYKFSWSARGALTALLNTARYYKDGKIEEVPSKDLMGTAKPYSTGYAGFAFVAYPNRDSTPYREKYNMPEVQTVIRGTLRYQGFPEFIRVLVDMSFLSAEENPFLKPTSRPPTWKSTTQNILNAASPSEPDLIAAITSKTSFPDSASKDRILAGLRWLGLFSDDPITPCNTPLDTLCATLEQKMQYAPGERDMVFLQHRFEIEHRDGRKETLTSTLVEYGSEDPNGYSAMARLVGVTCGLATLRTLNGKMPVGLWAPYSAEINDPLMEELREYGIECKEKTVA